MDRSNVLDAIMLGNDVAMQWYALSHDIPAPNQGGIVYQPTSGRFQASSGTILVIGGLLIGAYLLLK